MLYILFSYNNTQSQWLVTWFQRSRLWCWGGKDSVHPYSQPSALEPVRNTQENQTGGDKISALLLVKFKLEKRS